MQSLETKENQDSKIKEQKRRQCELLFWAFLFLGAGFRLGNFSFQTEWIEQILSALMGAFWTKAYWSD